MDDEEYWRWKIRYIAKLDVPPTVRRRILIEDWTALVAWCKRFLRIGIWPNLKRP